MELDELQAKYEAIKSAYEHRTKKAKG
jgi:hypothetical protein